MLCLVDLECVGFASWFSTSVGRRACYTGWLKQTGVLKLAGQYSIQFFSFWISIFFANIHSRPMHL